MDEWPDIILEDVLDADVVDYTFAERGGCLLWLTADSYDPVTGIWHDISGDGNHFRISD